MEHSLTRLEWLVGKDRVESLKHKAVAVFGCGGVGSFAIEALVRSGVGRLVVIDGDKVTQSNLNRQLIALTSTVGRRKVELIAERARDINPTVQLETHDMVYTEEAHPDFIESLEADYIIDAIDMVAAKLSIITICHRAGIPCISSMGTGNKMHPELLRISTIEKTHTCPLAKVMRKELKKRGISKQQVLFSTEKPMTPHRDDDSRSPGSCGFVPSVAGLMLAGHVLRTFLEVE